MTDQDTARQKIAALVERFQNTPKRERDAYNEDQTRHYFILPLFRALGWDTENPAEFSAEEQISRGFVDFGFYLNNVPAFYLETKRAAEKLEKPAAMRQAINYAYLKGVTWAVLTDFESLMVFNAEWETKDPAQARFLHLQHDDYANGGFERLWLLSKPAMQTRAMDKVAEQFGKKLKKEPVTKTLFADLTVWRRDLFNNIRQMGTTLWAADSRRVDNAVQKLLDRLIFVRTVEDRGVEANRLLALVRQTRPSDLFPRLQDLFRELDRVYNSNLFAMSDLDMMEIHDPVLLKFIIEGLYSNRSVDYDFNAITADVLGAVYEQYLGFKAQDPEGKQSVDKRQKRKAQGIYYTPQFVVRYIVGQTLGKILSPQPPSPSPSGRRGDEEEAPRPEGEGFGVRAENLLCQHRV